jgi:sigma-B regulation protein RsbU (phosphoserine phosphatase)
MISTRKLSIRSKITRAFLSVCVGSLGIAVVLTLLLLFSVRDIAQESGEQTGDMSAKLSGEALTDLALGDLKNLTDAKAEIMDQDLSGAVSGLRMIGDAIVQLYDHPTQYKPYPVEAFTEQTGTTPQLHWFIEADLVQGNGKTAQDLKNVGLEDETYLLGNIEPILRALWEERGDISSMYFSSADGINVQFDAQAADKAAYVKENGSLPLIHQRPWYVGAQESGDLYLSDTYSDGIGRGLNVSMSIPIYSSDGTFQGVFGFDIMITDLAESVRRIVVGDHGYAMLLGQDKVISSPDLSEGEEYELPSFWDEISQTDSGSIQTNMDGNDVYVVWTPVTTANWTLAYILPVSDVLAPATDAGAEITAMAATSVQAMNRTIYLSIGIFTLIMLVLVSIAYIISKRTAGMLSDPIEKLTKDALAIGGGDLEHELAVDTGDEIEVLAETISKMVKDIKLITGEKERIGAELSVATQIQASMLPCIFPAFPDRKEFDIYAHMLPAKEVGGDFYDFFLAGENTLAIVMSDVSGKGVPAALFMVIAKTLIKNNAQYGQSPGEVFRIVNNLLCENNEAGMFVTSFFGYIHLQTGEFTYVNAGHNPPLIRRNGEKFSYMKVKPGFILAGMEDMTFQEESLILERGDELFLYTDGVTEAVNPKEELFSEERLLDAANRHRGESLMHFVKHIKENIDAFAEDAQQADDITMLAFRFWGNTPETETAGSKS